MSDETTTVKFELQLNPVGQMSAGARLWVDTNRDVYLHKRDEEVDLLTQDGRTWVGECQIHGDDPSGTIFELLFRSTPGTPWSFRVMHDGKELRHDTGETRRHRTGFGGTL